MMKIQHVQRWKHSSKQTYKKRIFEKNRKGRAAGKAALFFLLSWLNASCTVLRNKKYKNLFHFGRNGYFDAKTEAGCEKTDCLDGGQAQ